ncbi:MAG: hypothetical protein J5699_03980 [Bacteroidales bacterium]|nr:hypothetical protein [Bacteroidales bacterium]
MKRFLLISALLLCVFGLQAQDLGKFHRGLDSLVFEYQPLADKPITLYYYIPTQGDVRKMKVLFSFHGAERSGLNPIICWQEFAERDGFVVLSPQFIRSLYDENQYQFGNVFKTRECKELNPEDQWIYSVVEPMFDFFKKETGNRSRKYDIQGHSAGGQFVHRFLIAKPDARVRKAVASNPGHWTWISDDGNVNGYTDSTIWPYTVKGTPFDDARHKKAYFKRRMVVHNGVCDTLTAGEYIATDPQALAEGEYRYKRGLNYYKAMKEYAAGKGYRFRWKSVQIEGIGHAGRGVVYGTYRTDGKGKKVYSADNYTKTGAYSLIYE